MTTARVVLRGSESYTLNNKTWLKDVPQIVKGEEAVKQFEANGYFIVKRIHSPHADPKKSDAGEQKRGFLKRTLPNKPEDDEDQDNGEDASEDEDEDAEDGVDE